MDKESLARSLQHHAALRREIASSMKHMSWGARTFEQLLAAGQRKRGPIERVGRAAAFAACADAGDLRLLQGFGF